MLFSKQVLLLVVAVLYGDHRVSAQKILQLQLKLNDKSPLLKAFKAGPLRVKGARPGRLSGASVPEKATARAQQGGSRVNGKQDLETPAIQKQSVLAAADGSVSHRYNPFASVLGSQQRLQGSFTGKTVQNLEVGEGAPRFRTAPVDVPSLSAARIRLRKRAAVTQLTSKANFIATKFNGHMSLGEPAQNLKVMFDTGSTVLWVTTGKTCFQGACRPGYEPEKSTTFKDLKQNADPVTYADGTKVEGIFVSDTVSLGSDVAVKNFKLKIAKNVATNIQTDDDGIVGLGLSPYRPTLWDAIIKQGGIVQSPVFSYFVDNTDLAAGLTFGGIDMNRMDSPMFWIKTVSSDLKGWFIPMTGLSIKGAASVIKRPVDVAIDTGSSLVTLPKDTADYINKAAGLKPQTIDGYATWTIPCPNGEIPKNLPDMTLKLGDITLVVGPKDYLLPWRYEVDSQRICFSAFEASRIPNAYVFGNALMRSFYWVFDQESRAIGIARANRSPRVTPKLMAASMKTHPYGVGKI